MTTQTAVEPWTPQQANRAVTTAMKKAGIAALLGVDPDSADAKEAARAKAMIDRFQTVALHAITSDPKLIRAAQENLPSVVQAVRDSALLGLEPVGITADGAIVVYEETVREEVPSPSGRQGATIIRERKIPTAHFQPMYRGLLKLTRRSGEIAFIDAQVVYQGDTIELDQGSAQSVKHFPALRGEDRGGYVGAYAVAELSNGKRYVEWMTYADIEEVRKSSRGNTKPDSPWVKFWGEMARKTVLRRLMKRLPLETVAEHGLRLEAEAERPQLTSGPAAVEEGQEEPSSARRRLRSRFVEEEPDPPAGPTQVVVEGTVVAETRREDLPEIDGQPNPRRVTVTGPDMVTGVQPIEEDPPAPVCGKASPYGEGQVCLLEPGHSGPHAAGEKETWL